jgi:hypothetical protein
LTNLDVSSSGVTSAAIEALQVARPQLMMGEDLPPDQSAILAPTAPYQSSIR